MTKRAKLTGKIPAGAKPLKAKTGPPRLPDNPFWEFSLAVYGHDGVSMACLALQERHGLDVNLLLYCTWAGTFGHALGDRDLKRLVEAARPWQDDIVAPLRAVRRRLKAYADQQPPAQRKRLREKVMAAELEAEAGEQQCLLDVLAFPAGAAAPGRAAANLLAYLALRGVPPSTDDTADLAALLAGAWPGLTPLEAVWLLVPVDS